MCYILTMKFANIIFQQKFGKNESTLTYTIPDFLPVELGQLVKIPLRKKTTTGIIFEIHNKKPAFKTLKIKEIIFDKPLLSKMQIETIKWMSEYYFCPFYKILKLFIPKRIFSNKPIRQSKTSKPKKINKIQPKILTKEQKQAIEKILKNKSETFLIHGITGSGKTEIYTRLAEHQISQGKQALILVPEISLTPQIIEYFEKSLGIKAEVIHSKISEGERYKAWKNIWEEKSKLIIGSRSAIFSPFQNLGIIIVDEEHELSYKQDQSPRYLTHKIAEKYKELKPDIKILYGSATPSIETAEKLKDSTILLTERIGDSILPEIEIIDLRDEFKKHNYSIFSNSLKEELKNIFGKKEQAILFINRRGSATSIVCRDCGYTEKCKNCELPMTYHSKTLEKPALICHHCGKIEIPPSLCPVCKGVNIRYLGIGTQKIESELRKEFPSARILRADKDTTTTKHGFKNIYESFKKHEADILIGTQMIAKGLHLPKVNLVGVILADIGLNIPDFRTAERNFQLMTQVAGRAGRNTKGKVIIQTYNPGHFALLCAKNHDYKNFFNYERTQRKILFNPPFGNLAKIKIENKSLSRCREEIENIVNLLKKFSENEGIADNLEINSYPSYIAKLRGKYHYIILIKSKSENASIHKLLEKLPKEYIMNANIKIDIDPITIT